jgi:amino acid transporter
MNLSEEDMAKLEAQTGNPLKDILSGNVPLGNLRSLGTWGLLNLIMALLALVICIIMIVRPVIRRKKEEEERPEYKVESRKVQRKGAWLLKIIAIIAGLVATVAELILDDFSLPMSWVNQWTMLIGILFVIHIILVVVYKLLKNRKEEEKVEYNELSDVRSEPSVS